MPVLAGAQAVFHGVGDLPGGIVWSQVRDAVKANGVLTAVGGSAANPNSAGADTAFIWTPGGGISAIPNLVNNTTGTSFITASAITPNGNFIATRSRNAATGNSRVATRVQRAPFALLQLQTAGESGPSAANAISWDGNVVYGLTNGNSQAVRYDIMGTFVTATIIPFLDPAHTGNAAAGRACSQDGLIMLGTSDTQDINNINKRAYRYVHGAGVSALPLLPGGTWSVANAITPSGNQFLLCGNSTQHPNGEFYIHNSTTGVSTPLGSPNTGGKAIFSSGFGGISADGAVVAISFGGDEAYIRNTHGWFRLANLLAAAGVNLVAQGWEVNSIFGMSPDATLVFGQGRHNGNPEGYVAEFPAGYLASYNPQPQDQGDSALVGAWEAGTSVMVFLKNGIYYHIQEADATEEQQGGADGFERGLYNLDQATGELTFTTLSDTNGSIGASGTSGMRGITATVDGDTVTISIPGEDSFNATRIKGGAGSLAGAWVVGNPAQADSSTVIVFLPDNTYYMANDATAPADGSARDGIERGTYAWNSATGAFLAAPTVNTDGVWGFSNDGGATTIRLSGDLRRLDLTVSGIQFAATRVPEPGLPEGPLTEGAWTLTSIGWVYGYSPLWGYSVFMGNVYLEGLPWVYQVPFGYLYLVAATAAPVAGGGTYYWFYSADLGWVFANDSFGGFFQAEKNNWAYDNFLNPNP